MKLNMLIVAVLSVSSLALHAGEADRFGGIVMKPAEGVVRFYDYQSRIAASDLMGFFAPSKECPLQLRFDRKAGDGRFDIAKASETIGDASVAVFVVDDPALPMSLLALEEKWGLVNVAKLVADNPKTLKLLRRADKLVTRVVTGLVGGYYSLEIPFSAMQPVFTLAELDKMEGRAIAPQALTQISFTIPKLGLSQPIPYTYERACIEGWAPAPTNAVQKEIWNDVKNPANRFKKDLPDLKK